MDLAEAEDIKRGAELVGKVMNEFSFRHVQFEMLTSSSRGESQGRSGYYIFIYGLLSIWRTGQSMCPQFPVKGCHLSL